MRGQGQALLAWAVTLHAAVAADLDLVACVQRAGAGDRQCRVVGDQSPAVPLSVLMPVTATAVTLGVRIDGDRLAGGRAMFSAASISRTWCEAGRAWPGRCSSGSDAHRGVHPVAPPSVSCTLSPAFSVPMVPLTDKLVSLVSVARSTGAGADAIDGHSGVRAGGGDGEANCRRAALALPAASWP